MNVLIVDDDPKIRVLLRRCLEGEGFRIVESGDEKSARKALESERFDLVTLDLNLGRGDGLELARIIRQDSNLPIIMITGKNDLVDRVVGLEIGADDYITKPFHVREVLARVRSVLRRAQANSPSDEKVNSSAPRRSEPGPTSLALSFDGLIARPDHFELLDRDGTPIQLTSGDFKLLRVFLENPKKVLSRERMMDLIEGPDWSPLDRTIDNQVARLRKKIENDPANPTLIKTVRGVGYTLTADVEVTEAA